MIRYLKTGRSFRIERTVTARSTIQLRERGFALEDGGVFSCGPVEAEDSIEFPQATTVTDLETSVDSLFPASVTIERLVLVTGSAEHSLRYAKPEDTSVTWHEDFVRLHLSVTNRLQRMRSLIDLGGSAASQLDLAEIRRIAGAMGEHAGERKSLPRGATLELAPHIVAGLLAHPPYPAAPMTTIHQSPHEPFSFDGYGKRIEEMFTDPQGIAPNFFRPSYRVRPVRAWFHIDLRSETEMQSTADFSAEAVVGPVLRAHGKILLPLLCRGSEGRIFATELEINADRWSSAITFTSSERKWFPYAAGTWGRTIRIRL